MKKEMMIGKKFISLFLIARTKDINIDIEFREKGLDDRFEEGNERSFPVDKFSWRMNA